MGTSFFALINKYKRKHEIYKPGFLSYDYFLSSNESVMTEISETITRNSDTGTFWKLTALLDAFILW